MKNIPRAETELVIQKLKMSPAVVILGPRQVGKTTLARQTAKMVGGPYTYLDIESGHDVAKIQDDSESYFEYYQDNLIVLDEVQAMPILFTRLRSIIDRNRSNGKFLLLGSASPGLVKGVSESLAGRISYVDLSPFKLLEVYPDHSWQKHWFRGGFPRAFLAQNDLEFTDWVSGFIRSYVERDLSYLFGYDLNPDLNHRLWKMLAHHHSGIFNAQNFARSLGVTSPVVNRYLDFMVGAFLVYKIQPWYINFGKRLVKTPKIYLKDSGILHFFHGVKNIDELINHPIVGASWEGYVIEQIMYHKTAELDVYYYRTHSGTEIDLLLVKGQVPLASIEIKYSNAPSISKGFFIGIYDLKTKHNFVITPSSDTYPVKNVMVCSLLNFLKNFLNEIK